MSCLVALIQLINAWWQVDRIRVPIATGRLLQLASGDRLLVQHEVYIVTQVTRLEQPSQDADPICLGMRYGLTVAQSNRRSVNSESKNSDSLGYSGAGVEPGQQSPIFYLWVLLPNELSRSPKIQWQSCDGETELLSEDVCVLESNV